MTFLLLTDAAADRWPEAEWTELSGAHRLPVAWGVGGCGALAAVAAALAAHPGAFVAARGVLARGLVRLGARAGTHLAGVVLVEPVSRSRAAAGPVAEMLLPTVPLPWPALVLPGVGRADPDFGRARVYAAMWEAAFDATATGLGGSGAMLRDFLAAHRGAGRAALSPVATRSTRPAVS